MKVLICTNHGDIECLLFAQQAAKTVDNFLQYVRSGFYDNTLIHRVVRNFVIQGGGHSRNMQLKKTRPAIKNEASTQLKNVRGTLSMARMHSAHSATSQFFINLKDNKSLDKGAAKAGYAVFGEITAGIDVADKISKVATGPQDKPIIALVIKSITLI